MLRARVLLPSLVLVAACADDSPRYNLDGLTVRTEDFEEAFQAAVDAGRPTLRLTVANRGDRPIQVGSHYHFAETNGALDFDRAAARGMRLNIASGTAVRFEPGQQRTVELVDYAGTRTVYGFRGQVQGAL